MTQNDRPRTFSPGQLSDGLNDLAKTSRPGYRDDLVQRTARTRQRPAWTFIERWLPMTLIDARSTALSPPLRAAWMLLLIGLLTAALVTSLVIVGSQLLRDTDPVKLNGMVPSLGLDETWDATAIPGLSQPSGLAVGPDGNLYVVNAGANEILVLDRDGNVVRRWGELGAGPGQFYFQQDSQDPSSTVGGVAVGEDGSVYVADTVNDRVQRFDAEGTFVRQIGGFGPGDGEFLNPFDLAVRDDGTLYVVDSVRDDIQRFDAEGGYLETIATQGTGDGQLKNTGGIALDASGALYNADWENDRLQSWTPDGPFRWSTGRGVDDAVKLTEPGDVAVDAKGFIYVTEAGRVTVLTPDLALASSWDAPDSSVKEEWLPVAIADDGTVYLSAEDAGVIYKLQRTDVERSLAPAAAHEATAAASPPAGASTAPSSSPVVSDGLVVGAPFAVPFSADQPDGWVVNWTEAPGGVELAKKQSGSTSYVDATVRVFVPTNAYADPCHSAGGPMDPPLGPSVDDLTAALTTMPGILVTAPPSDVTIDGHSGKVFDLESTLQIADCPDDGAWDPMWTYDFAGQEKSSGPGQNFHQRIAVLDVDGTRVLVEMWTFDGRREVVADAFRVFESIDFQ